MALGFGFNKTKVLAAAEKFVQQGKLPNAITEYLKVVKEDPKDLTVMNTVGDLYARLGQNPEALQYFKQVGEAYASEGFIVKAIAIYKKLTKLNPAATDCVIKLAELYSQQGLYNDARAQYLSIADRFLRAGNNREAARIFQKMLELDPENAVMPASLAGVNMKMGDKDDARDIFYGAAESLFRRGAMEASDEALGRVLALDPGHMPSTMLRGQIAAETGNPEKAIEYLEKVPDIDSQPEALRALLRVHLQLGNHAEALPIATKLLSVHNDLSGIISCGDGLMAAGQHEAALRLYDRYADRLLADDHDAIMAKITSAPAHLSSNAAALELVLKLCRKAGDPTHLNEVMELLAHALVQAGELVRARDLYNQLAALEPENPVHAQNYKQVSVKLGDDPANRPLTADEGSQALMVDELQIDAPAVDQDYPPEIVRSIRTALTDSELMESYNLPAKAIAPLEAVLPSAPDDVLLNQRLASLYVRAERFSEAARCCDALRTVYRKAGHRDLAAQYAEMSTRYHERAGEPAPEYPGAEEAVPVAAEAAAQAGALSPAAETAEVKSPEANAAPVLSDASKHWEEMTAVEPPDLASSHFTKKAASPARAGDLVGDLLEEIRFYISQQMWDEAHAAIVKCSSLAPGIPELDEFRREIEKLRRASAPAQIPEVEVVDETAEEQPEAESSVSTLVFDPGALGFEDSSTPPPFEVHAEPPQPAVPEIAAQAPSPHAPVKAPLPVSEPAPAITAATPRPSDPLSEMVLDVEKTLDRFGVGAPASRAPAPAVTAAPPLAQQPPASVSRPVTVTTPRAVPPQPAPIPLVPAEAATIVSQSMPKPAQEPRSGLADVFEEFKEDMEAEGAAAEQQDPETHYNLGIAFKEMGLLDEAIGEFQKVGQFIDRGYPFPHVLQVYTWLAECLLNKGAPQAAIKWYQRALQLPGVDEETRMAVYYEMAAAYEAAGNRQAAIDNFMEVYASNIDYRDVADRIKILKA